MRTTPGVRRTGIALVALLENEERTLYQEEIQHRSDISTRLQERRSHRGRRRGERWYRAPRFNNRRRAADRLPPSLESVVSNQEHRIGRLAARSGAATVVLQDSKFDTQKVLNPGIHGKEYQEGPLYKSHLREYVAEQWKHQCAYCGKEDWKDHTRFELDHVVPRSRNGPTSVGNIVWACHPCNEAKSDSDLETFLEKNPDRSTAVRTRKDLRPRLAAAGNMAWICQTLRGRLSTGGLKIRTTTGADTAHRRRELGITKNHANDAACGGSRRPVTQLRRPADLKAVGHGRRKQIKTLPIGRYLAWRHPATGRTTEDPVSRTRAAPEHRVRRRVRRPGAHTQRQEMGERQSASHSRQKTRCRQRRPAIRQHGPKGTRATDCTPKRVPRNKLRHYHRRREGPPG